MTTLAGLVCLAVVSAVAFAFFMIGRWAERRRIHRRLRESAAMHEANYSLSLLPALELMREDTAEMMREMDFYANANDSINCTTWGKG